MRNTLIILIVLAVVAIFYGQSFKPEPSPLTEAQTATQAETSEVTLDATSETAVPVE